MAHYSLTWSDNLHTTAFTPRDYQVELLASAREDNIIVCLSHESSKEFIALKLLQEFAYQIRRNGSHKCSLYLAEDGDSAYNLIHYLTDLKVFNANQPNAQSPDVKKIINENDVIILSPGILYPALIDGYLCLSDVNLIIIEKCHENNTQFHNLIEIFQEFYNGCEKKPKILGFAGPIHSADCEPEYIQDRVKFLETLIDSRTETASDIVTVLRYCTKPVEYIVECAPPSRTELTNFLQELVLTRVAFINEHRYDPSEIYSDEFMEELIAIPDPKKEPLDFLKNFLTILSEMGPWCADRAALNLLMQIEKQKVKTPYERHFLLLCLISTTFVQVRSYCDFVFQKSGSEKESVEKYSTPKVLRLLETLRLFKPEESKTMQKPAIQNSSLKSFAEEVDSLDFQILQINIENTIKTIECENSNIEHNLAPLEAMVNGIKESDSTLQEPQVAEKTPTENGSPKIEIADSVSTTTSKYGVGIRHRHKRKYNTGGPRNKHNYHNDWSNDPDALCGIIFCNHKNTAKILFSLLQEMSRHDPELKFLNVQYTVDRVADPLTEPKEAELEHRKQEEVLKRFRMHECNILIGTSVLEEGIDLPKCNLVIRWDQPSTYRSYVQCKGRARAPQAYHVILVAPDLGINMDNTDDSLSDKSHKFICQLQSTPPKDDEEQNSKSDSLPEEVTSGTSESLNDSVDENSTCSVKESDSGTGKVNGISDNKYENLLEIESLDELLANLNVNQDTKSPAKTTKGEKKGIEGKRTEIIGCVLANKKEEFAWTQSEPKYAAEKMKSTTDSMVTQLAEYYAIESMLLSKCANTEPADDEHREADRFGNCIQPYKPLLESNSLVTLDTAISLINKYCAKLPSDTFTKLTPIWRCAKTTRNGTDLYQYTIRLPINSPLKRDIQGLPMPTKMLARRMAAFIACKELHQHRELDDNLQPIGKEGFKATEPDWEDFELEKIDEQIVNENIEPRPGTTKRRQYYYKRIASAFSDCRPSVESKSYLYHIKMTLECPIPEEQNTRGRRIYPPEESAQGFGILTLKKIPKVSAFPIFTRSGEVRVALELSSDDIELTESQVERINTFLNYTFTNVLRLQKFLMLFDPEATENCFFIVPTVKTDNGIAVDWDFLELIYQKSEKMPRAVSDEDRANKEFDANQFKDAVVMPWYRNQDQPQYFYVAEICNHLSPMSSFPGENYSTFQEYYFRKYEITIQNTKQPLLDVDHTSARLNFLTPRYVNRKGVALPTSSEETKRAKRENLEQKQILVPELCTIHPFPASLWRAAVCLPCILYRINALLLADEIRKQVSYDLGLGQMEIKEQNFEWPTLDFGWSLAEVLKKSREAKITEGENVATTKENGTKAVDSKEQGKANEPVENGHNSDDDVANEDKSAQLAKGKNDEKTVNDLLEEVDEKLKSESFLEIGTWSNDMAENIPMGNEDISDDEWGLLPPNVNMCSRNKTNIRYGSPTSWEVSSSAQNPLENYYEDSDVSYQSEDDYDAMSIDSGENQTGPLRIEFKSNNTAEAIETEEEIQKREKQLAIINDKNVKDKNYQLTRNLASGFNFISDKLANPNEIKVKDEFNEVRHFIKEHIQQSGMLVLSDMDIKLAKKETKKIDLVKNDLATYIQIFPYIEKSELQSYLTARGHDVNGSEIKLTLDDYYEMNRMYLNRTRTDELYTVEGSGDLFDNFNDSQSVIVEEKRKYLKLKYESLMEKQSKEVSVRDTELKNLQSATKVLDIEFSFDYQPNLSGHPGPSPSIILQALTMSNANDGINLERLETIGDSFLKYAITTYLYITYENVHEGKLSHLRSKQVSNLNLYRLGRRKVLGECMIATKFEPHDNWLPPCYYVPKELEKALIEARIPACHWNLADLPNIKQLSSEEICKLVRKKAETLGLLDDDEMAEVIPPQSNVEGNEDFPCFIPYNLVTQHSIPDKSVADCVEALIGAYLIECGPRGALLFMAWLGIRVLPTIKIKDNHDEKFRIPGSTQPNEANKIIAYGEWSPPKSPLLTYAPNPYETLEVLLDGFSAFENAINYHFKDRSYLLQAMTHASYSPNRLTDCYQRLEFLGDAVLDYLITRHLYEDPRQHSPGALTDLRSALVNNTIFASLAVRHGFHKYFRHLSPALNEVIERFVRIQHENGHSISEEYYLLSEEECDEAEDVEVPKALGDVFESVAGAIFLDSNMSLDTVWKVYSTMMRPEIEQFSNSVPKSPIRELLELEPETAKFSKPEKLADGRRVRVTVEVFGKGTFRGIGRNYRIAKCTAAKCALRQLKKQGLISKKH